MDHVEAILTFALSLPEAHEALTCDAINLRVRKKIFCFPATGGMTVKADPDELEALLADHRFERAPYVGRFGWVTMTFDGDPDFDEIHELVLTSYCLVAPKTLARRAVEEFGAS